jgi:hypothetical protein
MSKARISHEDLELAVKALAEARDKELTSAKKFPQSAYCWEARAEGLRLAIALLHRRSHGAYGQSLEEQDAEAGK